MQFLNLIFAVIVHLHLVEGDAWTLKNQPLSGECAYQGYRPGGDVTNIADIKPPKLQIRAVSGVLGEVSTALGFTVDAINVIGLVSDSVGAVAGPMGTVLGVFAAVTGAINDQAKLKPAEVATATNNAIAELTLRMNNKLLKMESYVNSQIIHLEQRLIERQYKGDFRLWVLCATQATAELSKECQRDAFHTLNGHRPMFAILREQIMNNNKYKLTGLQTRELEVYLPVFRDYVNLEIMELVPLIKTYCKAGPGLDILQCNHYSRALQEAMNFAKTYTQKAVDIITKYHEAGTACKQTFQCAPLHNLYEGFWKAYTAKEGSCQCVLGYGTEAICTVPVTIREDGKIPWDYTSISLPCGWGDAVCAEGAYGKLKLFSVEKTYVAADVKVVKAYWKNEVLSFIPEWDKAYKFGTDHIKTADAGDAEFKDVLSPRFTERLIKAYDYPRKYD